MSTRPCLTTVTPFDSASNATVRPPSSVRPTSDRRGPCQQYAVTVGSSRPDVDSTVPDDRDTVRLRLERHCPAAVLRSTDVRSEGTLSTVCGDGGLKPAGCRLDRA